MVVEGLDSAKAAGLRYVYDSRPGIGRKKTGTGFRYVDADGKPVRDQETLGRIRSLAIPPAWVEVWICPLANGHLQATGRDARGRKQSRYHPKWRAARDEVKYERMLEFGRALPGIRRRVTKDMGLPGMPREKVLATIVRLMETTFIRVGNDEYARTNHSYGLTTMRTKHVRVKGATLHFDFSGKSGVHHAIDVNDRRLAKIVSECRDLPGYELFHYLDAEGCARTVHSGDVNEYLGEIAGGHFTAKDFRTWAGTVLACRMLRECDVCASDKEAKTNVVRVIERVAARLGNTPSVCRKCYVHPLVVERYLARTMAGQIARGKGGLRVEEADVMRLLGSR